MNKQPDPPYITHHSSLLTTFEELAHTYEAAIRSAELLRESGEVAKARRVESLARVIARELGSLKGSADSADAKQSPDR